MSPVRPPESLLQLPAPDAEAQAHSERLINLIADEIAAAGGGISFARYMELALFAPGLGYYSAGASKFGEQGDFVTAPEISPLFSRALAQQVAEVLAALAADAGDAAGSGEVLEVGGGTGRMAADMLAELETLGGLPERYTILELSADLQARQRQTLSQRVPHLLHRVQWLDALPAPGFRGVVVANELLDALPVHCFRVHKRGMGEAGLRERWVGFEQGRFQWRSDDLAPSPVLQQQLPVALLDQLSELPNGYESEVNLAAGAWVEALAERLAVGVVLLIDYGFPRHEYYHPQRSRGTLMCHYRHRAHDDPFVYPGLQDITAHVDFTAIAEAAVAAGLEVRGYNTQGLFLLGCGLAELAQRFDDPAAEQNERQQILQAQQIRRLTLPGEMGERFKVIALSRDYAHPLRGFALQDLRHQL